MIEDVNRIWFLVRQGEILQLISEYDELFYVVTFIWTFLEGETFVIFAGVAAHMGLLQLEMLIAVAWLGSFCGDQTYFFIGRRYGSRVLAKFPRWQPGVEKSLAWLNRSSTWFILTFRFIYGVRNFASFAMGMSQLPWSRFVWLNFIAAGIWAIAFSGAGYLLGQVLGDMLGTYAKTFLLGMLGLFACVIVTKIVIGRVRARRARMGAPTPTGRPVPSEGGG